MAQDYACIMYGILTSLLLVAAMAEMACRIVIVARLAFGASSIGVGSGIRGIRGMIIGGRLTSSSLAVWRGSLSPSLSLGLGSLANQMLHAIAISACGLCGARSGPLRRFC